MYDRYCPFSPDNPRPNQPTFKHTSPREQSLLPPVNRHIVVAPMLVFLLIHLIAHRHTNTQNESKNAKMPRNRASQHARRAVTLDWPCVCVSMFHDFVQSAAP